jgi:pheromone shutdown-related protein TraB
MNGDVVKLTLGDKEILLLGTAHISKESVSEVKRVIEAERPDRVCIEIDETRFKSLTKGASWSNLNVSQIIREGKGFLLLANLVLASFQRRLGLNLGVSPGEEMLAAIRTSEALGIPYTFCDREVHITLKRAWAKAGFWGKNKMLAAMLSSIFTRERLSEKDIEELKKKSALQGMLEELAGYLPVAKDVLIDERDIYLATKVYGAEGQKKLAVVGAGHVPGMIRRLEELHQGKVSGDLLSLTTLNPRGPFSKLLRWIVPVVIVAAILAGFFLRGSEVTVGNILKWILINGTLSFAGALIALAHPLTWLVAFLAAPITSLIPVIGVGLFTGLLEATLRKPRVKDFESLHTDLTSFRGFRRNRITHILIVFLLTNLGSTIGTFLGGIPLFTSLFG